MPVQLPSSCPHDLGPGTTVCLRCRQAEREAARARQQRVFGLGAVVVVIAGLLGSAAIGAVRGAHQTTEASAETVTQQGETGAPAVAATPLVAAAPAAAHSATPAAAPRTPPAFAPGLPVLKVAEGHTELPDGLAVERNGDQAVVSFDTPLARTRRRDKVEQVVRATLPALYGGSADSALARIPAGQLSEGDLLADVVPRGIRIPLSSGAIVLALETRPGQDGPLVVRYRARAVAR